MMFSRPARNSNSALLYLLEPATCGLSVVAYSLVLFALPLCVPGIAFCANSASDAAGAATVTALTITAGGEATASVAAGTVVTLTAKVTAAGKPVNPGQVKFCDAAAKYCTDIHLRGVAQLTKAGAAELKFRPGIGSHSYKAVFLGTNTYAGSASGATALKATGIIPPLATATTINQAGSWGAYTLSVTVTETGNTAPPSGTVSFLDTNHGNAVLGAGTLGAARRGVEWSTVNTSAPSVAGVSYAVADLNGDGIPDLFVKDYFGTYDVLLGKGDGTFTVLGSPFGPYSETGTFIVGDFNNDGIPDVAAINAVEYASTGNITIFLGNGDGTFTVAGSSPALGYNPTAIATADMNGDGNADLIVVEQGSSTSSDGQVVIFLGKGDGTFTKESSIASVASTASSIIPAYLNSDGNIDLVLTGVGQTGITILLGKGDGTFTTVAGPGQPGESMAAVTDVNNDGIPDLVFPAASTSDLTVFLGNGDGTFTEAPSSPNVNLKIGNFVIADFNQDGVPDIVYANTNTTTAGVLFGNGDGTFVQSPATLTYPYDFSGNLVVADFNGDGWPDVLTEDGNSRTVIDSLTHPTETAGASAAIALSVPGKHLVDASYAGSTRYSSSVSGTVQLWGVPPATTATLSVTVSGVSTSSVKPGTVVTLTAEVKAGGVPLTGGQVNFCDASSEYCTGANLLGTASVTGKGAAVFKFTPSAGTYTFKAEFVPDGLDKASTSNVVKLTVGPAAAPHYTATTTLASMGYPGDYSLTATLEGFGGTAAPTGDVSFLDTSYKNTVLAKAPLSAATPGIGWRMGQTPAFGSTYPLAEVTADFNGDGIPDLALLWNSDPYGGPCSVTIFIGKGDGTFTTGTTIQVTGVLTYSTMVVSDINGDDKTDLAILGAGSNTSFVTTLLSNGNGTFAAPKTSTVFNQGVVGGDEVPGSVVAADFNGDGKMDLAVVGDYARGGGVTILLGKGDGTFQAAGPNLDPSADFGLVATGDFNRDGIPDLVVTNYSEFGTSPIVFLGKGDGTFTAKAKAMSLTLDYFPTSIVVGDFNDDGIPDLAFSDLNGVEIALGKGDGTFTETSASPIRVPSELYSLVAGDFNHDGKLDLAGIDNYNMQIDLLEGDGKGGFTEIVTTPNVSQDWLGPFQIVAADFNKDGVPDLAMLTKNQNTVSILLTEPTETATATVTGIAPVGVGTHNVEASYAGDSHYAKSISGTVQLTAGLKPPTIAPAAKTYTSVQKVTIAEAIPGATIFYEAWGPYSTNGYVEYTGPFFLPYGGTESIQAYATEIGYQQSSYTTATYNLILPTAPAPVFSLAAGRYPDEQTVTITDAAVDATIYYTTNGTPPSEASTVYTGSIKVSSSELIAAIALAPGYSVSGVASAQYLIGTSQSRFIYTVAGTQAAGDTGDGGPATLATLEDPYTLAFDAGGDLYIADGVTVRKIAAGTGIVTTVAGTGILGYSGNGGLATKAQLGYVEGLAFDKAGDLYLADETNCVVRKVAVLTGIIGTVAGNGTCTYAGDNGPAAKAELNGAYGLAFDKAGNLYIGTYARIRMVAAGTGTISTFVGNGNFGYSGDKGPATQAEIEYPAAIAFDAKGNLYFTDSNANEVREVSVPGSIITTVAGAGRYGNGNGNGDGGPATSATLYMPQGLTIDKTGNLFVAESNGSDVREVTASDQIIHTIAGADGCYGLGGDGGPALSAGICYPSGLALGATGSLYVAEPYYDRVREITTPVSPPTGVTAAPVFSLEPGTYPTAKALTMTAAAGAEIYIALDGSTPTTTREGYYRPIEIAGAVTVKAIAVEPGHLPSAVASAAYKVTAPAAATIATVAGSGMDGFSAAGTPALQAKFGYLNGVAADGADNLYMADPNNGVVWKVVAATKTIEVAAGTPGMISYQFSGAGRPATEAVLGWPEFVALDGAGNLFISDLQTRMVYKVTAKTGIITVYAGSNGYNSFPVDGDGGQATVANLGDPQGIAVDKAGNLYIADAGVGRIRRVDATTGIITSVAGKTNATALGDGGPATAAMLAYPQGVALDGAGNMFIVDRENNARIREVAAKTGIITTVAGNGIYGFGGDGGLATKASIGPYGIAIDAAGAVYFSNGDNTVRKFQPGGTIDTIAGTGYWGFSGDGGAARVAEVCGVGGLAFDKAGSLYLADECNLRVRKVSFVKAANLPLF